VREHAVFFGVCVWFVRSSMGWIVNEGCMMMRMRCVESHDACLQYKYRNHTSAPPPRLACGSVSLFPSLSLLKTMPDPFWVWIKALHSGEFWSALC
jgi:hypothetical protein